MMNIQKTGPQSPTFNVLADYLHQAHLEDKVALAVEPFDNLSEEAKEAIGKVNQRENAEKSDMVIIFVYLKENGQQPVQGDDSQGTPASSYDSVDVRNRVRKQIERYLGQNPEYFDADMGGQKIGFVVVKTQDAEEETETSEES